MAGFAPARRTAEERVALEDALRRVPATPVLAPHDLPGFARATVDGYAVRAADTYGASEGLPGYLEIAGTVAMGAAPGVEVTAGRAVAIPTGAVLPPGADAVVMIEHTQEAMEGTVEVLRPVAPGDGMVRADEDARAGAELVPAGRPLRSQDLGLLAAAGVTEVDVHIRPRVAILSTGDEVVDPATARTSRSARCATRAQLPWRRWCARRAANRCPWGSCPTTARRCRPRSRPPSTPPTWWCVSAGSSVGGRDETAAAVAALGPPGIWCHGLAIKPGKPTLLAECGGVPVIGLPGNPRSALVVFRLIGMPLVRRAGGWTAPPHEAVTRARLERDVPSAAGRLDVVQVSLSDGVATPLFGLSALLSVLTAADGYLVIDEPATGLAASAEVEVTLYG